MADASPGFEVLFRNPASADAKHYPRRAEVPGMLPPRDEMMRAFYARDRRADGQFFTGVVTTGIYCLASCPARKPLPGNVRFFATRDAARAAGFRACLRCRPDDDERRLVRAASEAAREDPALARPHVLARAVGATPARLRRAFERETGERFAAYLRRRRLLAAAQALGRGASAKEAARVAGYASTSGFYAAFRRLKGASPARWARSGA
jgi:methylphosphotriester-DNA--protein-cysteine methyltransferase